MYTSDDRLIVTPLRVPEIGPILKAGFSWTPVPIYRCGAADGQAVRRLICSVATTVTLSYAACQPYLHNVYARSAPCPQSLSRILMTSLLMRMPNPLPSRVP